MDIHDAEKMDAFVEQFVRSFKADIEERVLIDAGIRSQGAADPDPASDEDLKNRVHKLLGEFFYSHVSMTHQNFVPHTV
jgi:hypothetical protein